MFLVSKFIKVWFEIGRGQKHNNLQVAVNALLSSALFCASLLLARVLLSGLVPFWGVLTE